MKILSGSDLPSKMRALILNDWDGNPVVQEVDVPVTANGDILVKI